LDPITLAALAGGSALIQGGAGMYAANQQRVAARDQLRAAGRAQGAITDAYGKAQGYQQPYLGAGQEGLSRMMSGNYETAIPGQPQMPGEYQAPQFNYDQYQDPGTQYRMQMGQQAVQSGAAGQGSGLSGATLKALAKFGQNLGSQEYGAAYGRFNQDRGAGLQGYQTNLGRANDIWGQQKDIYGMGAEQAQQRYGRASDLGNMGQQAAGNMSDLASNYGSNLAGLYGTMGQIKAGGRTAAANSTLQGVGGAVNTGMDAMTLGMLGGGQTPGQAAQSSYNSSPYGPAADKFIRGGR
jgi:hypothetical protein